jgi:hypothetical protein
MITDWWTISIAAYAAIVATGALALELRRWFESGPRLSIQVMPEMKTFNMPGTEGNTYLFTNVANRGNAPTTITHFALCDYGSWFRRLRSKSIWTAVVPHPSPPGIPSNIPHTLQPGEIWCGMARHDSELKNRMAGGQLHVIVYASHADKPMYKRVRLRAKPPEDAEKV